MAKIDLDSLSAENKLAYFEFYLKLNQLNKISDETLLTEIGFNAEDEQKKMDITFAIKKEEDIIK